MTKQELRKSIKALTQEHSLELESLSESLCEKILESQYLDWADIVLCYMALDDEVNLNSLMKVCIANKKPLFVPRVNLEDMTMDFFCYEGEVLAEGSYGIKEPGSCGVRLELSECVGKRILVLTPGRGFTRAGDRLGRGKGFYDKYFSMLEKAEGVDLLLAGVCFPFQVLDEIPVEAHDRKMDVLFF